jgi:hypothetical protein
MQDRMVGRGPREAFKKAAREGLWTAFAGRGSAAVWSVSSIRICGW